MVASALDRNTDVALAAQRVVEARAQFALAQAQRMPSLGASLSGGRQRDVSPFGKPQLQTEGVGVLSVSYDLDLFGRLRNQSAAARAALLATEAGQENVRLAIISATVAGYIDLRTLDAQLAVARDTLTTRGEELRIAKRQADTGYGTLLQVYQAEAEYRATEQLVVATRLGITEQENGLSILLGEIPGNVARGAQLASLAIPGPPERLPSELLRRRPDIIEAEQTIVAADRSLDAARAAFMPNIELMADGGYALSTLLANPIGIFSLGGSILAPLFEGGRLTAQADIAAARRDQAAFAYRRTVLVAFQEVENARAAITSKTEQEAVVAAERDALARAFALASNRYRAGYASYLEQLDAQRNLLAAELGILEARNDHLQATVQLYRALGGDWTP